MRLTDLAGKEVSQFYFRQPFRVTLPVTLFIAVPDGHFEVSISALDGTQRNLLDVPGWRRRDPFPSQGRVTRCQPNSTSSSYREITRSTWGFTTTAGPRPTSSNALYDFRGPEESLRAGSDYYRWNRVRGFMSGPKLHWDLGSPEEVVLL